MAIFSDMVVWRTGQVMGSGGRCWVSVSGADEEACAVRVQEYELHGAGAVGGKEFKDDLQPVTKLESEVSPSLGGTDVRFNDRREASWTSDEMGEQLITWNRKLNSTANMKV